MVLERDTKYDFETFIKYCKPSITRAYNLQFFKSFTARALFKYDMYMQKYDNNFDLVSKEILTDTLVFESRQTYNLN